MKPEDLHDSAGRSAWRDVETMIRSRCSADAVADAIVALVDVSPWWAALAARKAIRRLGGHGELHAALGLALGCHGEYEAAVRAYQRALALDPGEPRYAHNLGHILDVGLGRSEDALPFLESSARQRPDDVEIVASYALCLARLGRTDAAERVLTLLGDAAMLDQAQQERLRRWIQDGLRAGR